jgi:hypothetical protein
MLMLNHIPDSTGPEPMEKVRKEYMRLRNQQREEQQLGKATPP